MMLTALASGLFFTATQGAAQLPPCVSHPDFVDSPTLDQGIGPLTRRGTAEFDVFRVAELPTAEPVTLMVGSSAPTALRVILYDVIGREVARITTDRNWQARLTVRAPRCAMVKVVAVGSRFDRAPGLRLSALPDDKISLVRPLSPYSIEMRSGRTAVARSPARPPAKAPVPSSAAPTATKPPVPSTSLAGPAPATASPGRTLLFEWTGRSRFEGGRVERVEMKTYPGHPSTVATFKTRNRDEVFQLGCVPKPEPIVVLHYALPAHMQKWHEVPEATEVLVNSRMRDDLSSPKPGWQYGVRTATLTDPAHVLAYAKVLASEGRMDIEFMRYYTGPTMRTTDGTVYGGRRFPQGGPGLYVMNGRPAVEAVLKACGYPTNGLRAP